MTVIAQDDHLTAGAWAACGGADINACPYLENIRIVTRRVCFKVLGYSRHAIWTPKSAQKVITENSSTTLRSDPIRSQIRLSLICINSFGEQSSSWYPNTCAWCGIQSVICSWLYELLMSLRSIHQKRLCSKRQLLNSFRWPIYDINSVDNTYLPCYILPPTQHHSSS